MPGHDEGAGSDTEKEESDEDDDDGEAVPADSDDDDDDDDDEGESVVPNTWYKMYSQTTTGGSTNVDEDPVLRMVYPPNKPDFAGPKPGPSNKSRSYPRQTPLDCFQLFWSEAVLAEFCTATNAYAKLFMTSRWRKDMDVKEFKGFLAIILSFGIVKYPAREDAWCGPHSSRFVSSIMSCTRFKAISAAWHWEDYSALVPEEPLLDRSKRARAASAAKKKGNAFWPVKSLIQRLCAAFKSMWNLHQYNDVDEQSIGFKGRHIYRCFNPSKPDKYHFKLYSLNDGQYKYQYDCYLYDGSQTPIEEGQTASSMPIYVLIYKGKEFDRKNYIFVTDNWYTSFAVLVDGLRRGIHHIGTVKMNRKNNPIQFMFGKQARGASPRIRGDCLVSTTIVGNVGNVFCTAWQDKKAVHILSTYNAGQGHCNRMIKTAGKWASTELRRPDIVADYNFGMGGTDGMDQMISYINPRIKSAAWPNRIFLHMLMVSVCNAHIIYYWLHKKGKVAPKVPGGRNTDMRYGIAQFVSELTEQLASASLAEVDAAKRDRETDDVGGHVAEQVFNPEEGTRDKKQNKFLRGLCHECKVKVPTYCPACGKYFCINKSAANPQTCWTKHHHPVETSPKPKSGRFGKQ